MHAVPGRARPVESLDGTVDALGRALARARLSRAPDTAIFGIVQGGVHPDLRQRSAARLVEIGFDGYAIGGLAIGEGQATTFAMVEATVPACRRTGRAI